MTDYPIKTYYMGKDIEEMSREELIEALQSTGRLLATYQTPNHIRAHAFGSAEMLKRGERRWSL